MPPEQTQDSAWHLDKRLPIGLILGLLAQSAAIVWWASAMEARQSATETMNAEQASQIDTIQNDAQRMAVGAATVNAQLQAVRDSLGEVKATQRETQELVREIAGKLK